MKTVHCFKVMHFLRLQLEEQAFLTPNWHFWQMTQISDKCLLCKTEKNSDIWTNSDNLRPVEPLIHSLFSYLPPSLLLFLHRPMWAKRWGRPKSEERPYFGLLDKESLCSSLPHWSPCKVDNGISSPCPAYFDSVRDLLKLSLHGTVQCPCIRTSIPHVIAFHPCFKWKPFVLSHCCL